MCPSQICNIATYAKNARYHARVIVTRDLVRKKGPRMLDSMAMSATGRMTEEGCAIYGTRCASERTLRRSEPDLLVYCRRISCADVAMSPMAARPRPTTCDRGGSASIAPLVAAADGEGGGISRRFLEALERAASV